jgi:hypothetical protein
MLDCNAQNFPDKNFVDLIQIHSKVQGHFTCSAHDAISNPKNI